MGGGLMQLVAYGAQDIYLTGNPQITFFKVVYRRHTNFAMECIQQTINGTSTLTGSNSTGSVTVSRNGDLVGRVYCRVDANDGTDCLSGDQLISDVTLEIGGQQIDKQTREWLQVWAELSTPDSKAHGYKYLTGGYTNTLLTGGTTGGHSQQSVMVPLQFWFCRNPGLALPLIALQYHEIKLKFTWGTTTEVSRDGSEYGSAPSVEVWADYFYLDTDERRRFAQVSHEYLIEQLQYQENTSAAVSSKKLNFNHPVKELVWVTDGITTQRTKLTLNGHDRFAEQDREYFQIRQMLDYHTAVPGYNIKEMERPQLLAAPENILGNVVPTGSVEVAGDASANGKFTITSSGNLLKFRAAADPGLKVGDILAINYEITADASTNTVICEITSVTTAWSASNTTAVFVLGAGATELEDSVAGDGSVYRIATRQNPQSRCSQLARNINVYSFALKPEEHQPSGTCNFSRIDTAYLKFSASVTTVLNIYAVNYNVLRIMSGMGGLAYSN
tara:strand:- start:965 stop:2470 length:1506 start_codon:yes stop_codon:yes gene_type:complete